MTEMGIDMKNVWFCLIIAFILFKADFWPFAEVISLLPGAGTKYADKAEAALNAETDLSAMEALDLVKERYAADFEKIYISQDRGIYCYKLPDAELYLAYEGFGGTEDDYLIHLYEFVTDEPDSGLGHCYSYAWYSVNRKTGSVILYEP